MGKLRSPEEQFMPPEYWIDMSLAPKGSAQTATGFPRSARYFWTQLLDAHPELFSPENADRIRTDRAPLVDGVWLAKHKSHVMYVGDTLIHHHIEQSWWAGGIPRHFHSLFHRELHSGTYGP